MQPDTTLGCSSINQSGCKHYTGMYCVSVNEGYTITRNGIETCSSQTCKFDISIETTEDC